MDEKKYQEAKERVKELKDQSRHQFRPFMVSLGYSLLGNRHYSSCNQDLYS